MADILLVEDDDVIGRALSTAMISTRHRVRWCTTGAAAIDAARDRFDLVVLDLGLPDMDGADVCRALRSRQPGAVIVILTAREAEIDVIVGLEAGADDYLTKPIRTAEFLARMRAHLRRDRSPASGRHVVGALVLDEGARRVELGGREVSLRAKEFDLLARLARDAGTALRRSELMSDVWDTHWHGSTKTLDVHVASLRRALELGAAESQVPAPVIETLRGFGYRLTGSAEPSGSS